MDSKPKQHKELPQLHGTEMDSKPKHKEPHGMERYDLKTGNADLGALSNDQQERLNHFKVNTRVGNEKYFREHPEVECMLADFLSEVLLKQPENIREFAAEHFTNPNLRNVVNEKLQQRQQYKNKINF